MRAIFAIVVTLSLTGCAALIADQPATETMPPIAAERLAPLVLDMLEVVKADKTTPILIEDGAASATLTKALSAAGFTIAPSIAASKTLRRLSVTVTPLARGFLLTVILDGKQASRLYGFLGGSMHPRSALMIKEDAS